MNNRQIDVITNSVTVMSKAAEVLQRIIDNHNNGSSSNFDSDYTKAKGKTNFPTLMKVDSERLFNDLTPDERMHFAQKDEKGHEWPLLCIWDRTWIYVPLFKSWHLVQVNNLWDSRNSIEIDYKLVLWEGSDYLVDVDNCRLFKEVETDDIQGR